MASSLNPDAPLFITARNRFFDNALQLTPDSQNPNYPCFPSYPTTFYYPIQATMVVTPVPSPYFTYQYYNYGYNTGSSTVYHFVARQAEPDFPPVTNNCTIRELDENSGTEISNNTDEEVREMTVVMPRTTVLNRRRVRPPVKVRPVRRGPKYLDQSRSRTLQKVPHRMYEIRGDAAFERDGMTTLMIKNLPNRFSKGNLIAILREHCKQENEIVFASKGKEEAVLSEFDYFYLPIDFRTTSNFGYAFVNFTSPVGAWRLYKYLHNYEWWSYAGSHKKCEVNFARVQGLAACIQNADRMSFHGAIPAEFLPVHFDPPSDGFNEPVECPHGCRI